MNKKVKENNGNRIIQKRERSKEGDAHGILLENGFFLFNFDNFSFFQQLNIDFF